MCLEDAGLLEGDFIRFYAIFAFPCLRNLRDRLGRESGWENKKEEVGVKGELMSVTYCLGCSLSSPFPSVAPGYEMRLSHLYSNLKVQVICDGERFYPISYQPAKTLPSGWARLI